MGIWLIAKDNIKKKKGNAIILFLLVSLAMLLMYVGISVLTNMGSVIDSRNVTVEGADYFLITSTDYPEKIKQAIKEQPEVTLTETEEAIFSSSLKFYKQTESKEEAEQLDFIFLNKDTARELSKLNVIDAGKQWNENSIILPFFMKVGMKYQTGDILNFVYKDQTYSFEVYGFAEDILFSTTSNVSAEKCFVSSVFFEKEQDDWAVHSTIFRAKLEEASDTEKFGEKMDQMLSTIIPDYQETTYYSLDYDGMKLGTAITANIFMAVLTVFAVLLILISLIIVRFNVDNSISGNIKNIGILEACGYTSRQLTAATLLEFLMISSGGIVAGILIANVAASFVGSILSASIGMQWKMGFDPISALISAAVTILLVLLSALFSSGKYKKIAPLDALRNGINAHNFNRNIIKMEHTKLPLAVAIGVKNILYNKKKNTAVFLIIVLLSFCTNEAVSIYLNLAVKQDKLIELAGFEYADIMIMIKDKEPANLKTKIVEVKEQVTAIPSVQYALEYTACDLICSNGESELSLNCDAYDDTDRLVIDNVTEGRRPKYDNEIMLSTIMAAKLNVTTGDTVYLELNNNREDYLVTGIYQGINHLGKKAMTTKDGFIRLNENLVPGMLYVYLDKDADLKTVIKELNTVLKDEQVDITNYHDYVGNVMSAIVNVMKILCLVMLIVVLSVIAMTLVLLIQSQLVRDKKLFGIYKALGYTTSQLIGQIIMSYIPTVVAGCIAGSIIAIYGTNATFIVCLSAFGIKKCDMNISFFYLVASIVLTTLWAAFIVLISSVGIRKIVPYEMMQEE